MKAPQEFPLSSDVVARIIRMPRSILAALLRIARRIDEGFEGEITISVQRKGIAYIRWSQTETGNTIKEEL